jgi:hypothetical protein
MDPTLQPFVLTLFACYAATAVMVAAGTARVMWEVAISHGPMDDFRAFLEQGGHSSPHLVPAGYVLATFAVGGCALAMGICWFFLVDLSGKSSWLFRLVKASTSTQASVRGYAGQWAAERNLRNSGDRRG